MKNKCYNVKGGQVSRNGNKLVYDIDGHLASVVREDGTNLAGYAYDALGRRIAKKTYNNEGELEEERRFIYQGQRVLDEYARSSETSDFTIKRRYVYGNYVDEVVLAVHDLYVHMNYHNDRQYNIRSLSDWAQRSIEHYTYTPYGKRTVDTRWVGNNRSTSPYGNYKGFTGRYLDKETGLYYFRARYYDAEQGRFISRDPAGYVDGMGLYNGYFAGGFALDPSGLKAKDSNDSDNCPKDCPKGKDVRIRTKKGKTEYRTKEQNEKEIIPNGCSSAPDTNRYGMVTVNFRPACDEHDRCYATCGSLKSDCDSSFKEALFSICNRTLRNAGWLNRWNCRNTARTYHLGVWALGGSYHKSAQDEHCVWKECKKANEEK